LNANISLDIVDKFLDYVNQDDKLVIPPVSSSMDEREDLLKSWEVEDINEDDAIAGFLARVERVHAVAAAAAMAAENKAAISATARAAAAEAAKVAAERAVSSSKIVEESGIQRDGVSTNPSRGCSFTGTFSNLSCLGTHPSAVPGIGSMDTRETQKTEVPEFEVGLGALSPTKVGEFVTQVDQRKVNGAVEEDKVKYFKQLLVPLIDGHKPNVYETARIRQAALNANISLDIVDKFLDYVNQDDKLVIPPVSSSMDEREDLLKSWEVEDINEDDAIAGFLARVERVHAVAAAAAMAAENKAAISATARAAAAEAAKVAAARNVSTLKNATDGSDVERVPSKSSKGCSVVKSFSNLSCLGTHSSAVPGTGSMDTRETQRTEVPRFEVGLGTLSPTKVGEFITHLDRKPVHGTDQEKVKYFKQLIVPLVDGHKPNLYESARIRQAALNAKISLELVDNFLDYVTQDDNNTVLSPASSGFDEIEDLLKSWEVEDTNDDEAIAEFMARVGRAHTTAAANAAPESSVAAVDSEVKPVEDTSMSPSMDINTSACETKEERNEQQPLESSSFLEQFEGLHSPEDVPKLQNTISSYATAMASLESHTATVESVDSEEVEVQLDLPAFEVGQGPLSPTKLSDFVASVEKLQIGSKQRKEIENFECLILPVVDGHKPSMYDSACIRQAAIKARIPLDLVDNFLDSVNKDESEEVQGAASSEDDLQLEHNPDLDRIEDHNDDEAIEAFLSRVRRAHSEAAATEEANQSLSNETLHNPFLQEFEELDLNEQTDNIETDDCNNQDKKSGCFDLPYDDTPAFEVGQGVLSPTKLTAFFAEIDQQKVFGKEEEQNVKSFRQLILPLVNGDKPTVIQEAQIRQSAIKSKIPLDLVDNFLEHVKSEQHVEIAAAASSKDEDQALVLKGWDDDIEEFNEDIAIAAFLSRFSARDPSESSVLREGTHSRSTEAKEEEEKLSLPKVITDEGFTTKLSSEGTLSPMPKPSLSSDKEGTLSLEEKVTLWSDSEVPLSLTPEPTVSSVEDGIAPGHGSDGRNINAQETEEDEAWWEHAGSPENACEDDVESKTSDPKQPVDAAAAEMISRGIQEAAEKKQSHKRLSIDTDFNRRKNLLLHRFDEDIWRRRTAMATYGWGWEEATWLSPRAAGKGPIGIDGVMAAEGISNFMFTKDSFTFAKRNWKLSYKQRTKEHAGYFDVDLHSLQQAATYGEGNWPQDDTPWELRYVRQRFLHERSLSFSRNWFGTFKEVNGNDKIKAPVCKPKSMEMPMNNIPEDGEWEEEWYTSWSTRRNMPKPQNDPVRVDTEREEESMYESSESESLSESSQETGSSYTDSSTYVDDEDEWEDAPECGTFLNVKQKIGERVTRVHYDHTSSLRKSRWRKKYFPKGTFPY